jgi:hypothetical protein
VENVTKTIVYANISQRAADSFRRMLSRSGETELGDVHVFFEETYDSLYKQPEAFGLPLGDDISIAEKEPEAKEKKQEVKRRLDKPRGMIMAGLDYLRYAGINGRLNNSVLMLNEYTALLKVTKVSKNFLAGLEGLGLIITLDGDTAQIRHSRLPYLAAELQLLGRACAGYKNVETGKFQFARCDGRALRQAEPDPVELYRAFDGIEFITVMQLHEFFSKKGYKTTIEVNGALSWVVKYQGDRKVKSTPLFQIEQDDRHARPLRMQIKCVSTQRIAGLLALQPQLLQVDFCLRMINCNGDACGWCHNNKTLGPTLLEINGEPRTVCWYSYPDIHELNENTVELVQQYERLHSQLA